MWYDIKAKVPDWTEATKFLAKADPAMKELIKKIGPCTLAPRKDYYLVLCRSIFNQRGRHQFALQRQCEHDESEFTGLCQVVSRVQRHAHARTD